MSLDEDYSDEKAASEETKLNNSIVSLECAPLTKGIRVSNIPQGTSSDDIKFKFSNRKIGGSKVTDMMVGRNNGVASVYFEDSSGRNKAYCLWLFKLLDSPAVLSCSYGIAG